MLTRRESNLSNLMIFIQILITSVIFIGLNQIYPTEVFSYRQEIFLLIQILLFWYILFDKFKLGIIFRATSLRSMLHGYLSTVFFGSIVFIIEVHILSKYFEVNELSADLFLLFFALTVLITLTVFKILFYKVMRFIRRNGYNIRRVMIIADRNSVPFIKSFTKSNDWGYRLTSVHTIDESLRDDFKKVRIIRHLETLKKFIINNPVDDIFYCVSIENKKLKPQELIELSETIGINFHLMLPEYYNEMTFGNKINYIKAFKSYHTVSTQYINLKLKKIFDLILSCTILLCVMPLMCIIMALIKFEDGGPVFFKQERIGLNGRRFKCLKFRSMVVNAEELRFALLSLNESDGPTFKIEKDPRITRIGRFLRKTSLDELPQFINVMRNEMSIIGPRPPLFSEVQQYEASQIRRLSMKPGISCIWQVWGRNQVSFDEWMRMDLEYIDNWSLKLDLKIFFATIFVIFKGTGK